MAIYNSVILDRDGIIRQVCTTLPEGNDRLPEMASGGIPTCFTLYAFSHYVAFLFIEAFQDHHFKIDDEEPGSELHALVQSIVVSGSEFVNPRLNDHRDYAELVICLPGQERDLERAARQLLSGFIGYANRQERLRRWRAFAFRKMEPENSPAWISISVGNS